MKSICLLCETMEVVRVFSLPDTPVANSLSSKKKDSNLYPLELGICKTCGHIQLTEILSPRNLFADYPYLSNSGFQASKRIATLADELSNDFSLIKNRFVLEIGSNDGYLLRCFKNKGWSVLGIDPSYRASEIARGSGIENICDFFSFKLAQNLLKDFITPGLIIANNVLAHSNNMNDIFLGISLLMNDETVLVIEFSYALDVFEKTLFDTIYHEHMSYHSLNPFTVFLNKFDLIVFDAVRFDAHGGSLRIYVKKYSVRVFQSANVTTLLQDERNINLNTGKTWIQFEKRINELKSQVKLLLSQLSESGKKIVGFGVPAKFTTLFYALELDEKYFTYLVDDNHLKHNKFAPGTELQIFDSARLKVDPPDYVFLFSWNYKDSIVERLLGNSSSLLGVIVPVPELKIYGRNLQEL